MLAVAPPQAYGAEPENRGDGAGEQPVVAVGGTIVDRQEGQCLDPSAIITTRVGGQWSSASMPSNTRAMKTHATTAVTTIMRIVDPLPLGCRKFDDLVLGLGQIVQTGARVPVVNLGASSGSKRGTPDAQLRRRTVPGRSSTAPAAETPVLGVFTRAGARCSSWPPLCRVTRCCRPAACAARPGCRDGA